MAIAVASTAARTRRALHGFAPTWVLRIGLLLTAGRNRRASCSDTATAGGSQTLSGFEPAGNSTPPSQYLPPQRETARAASGLGGSARIPSQIGSCVPT